MELPTAKKNNEVLALINSSVRGLKAYHLEPEECGVKLNQNENPADWPAEIKAQAAEFLASRPWNRYPNFIPNGLKEGLARYAGVEPGNIIVGNGSNEMLLVLMLSFAATAKSVIICSPTFTVYKLLCDGMNVRTVNVSLDNNLQYDVNAIKSAVTDNPGSILILCSPNNPVGNTISESDFKDILNMHTGICILDQAYVEFGGFDGVRLLPDYPHLIIARTFSKAMGAAGLRLGYMIGAAELIREVNKIKLPYNINFATEYIASLILENAAVIKDAVRSIISERDNLYNCLTALPFENVYPSEGNFILARTSRKQNLFDHLKRGGILVRDVSSYPLLDNCLRISIGTRDENLKLRESLDKFFC